MYIFLRSGAVGLPCEAVLSAVPASAPPEGVVSAEAERALQIFGAAGNRFPAHGSGDRCRRIEEYSGCTFFTCLSAVDSARWWHILPP